MQHLIDRLRLLTLFLVELLERHLSFIFVILYFPVGLGAESLVKELFTLLVAGLTRVQEHIVILLLQLPPLVLIQS